MLVQSIRNIQKFPGSVFSFAKGKEFIVLAKSDNVSGSELYILPLVNNVDNFLEKNPQLEPLSFDAGDFELIADKVSMNWISRVANGENITSFSEWFDEGFWIRAHDWSLEEKDFPIIKKYYKEYAEVYKPWTNA